MKKILMLMAMSGMALGSMAQSEAKPSVDADQDKYAVVTNKFWDNWFISAGVGGSVLMGDFDTNVGNFGQRISPTINIAVGKWFTPGIGGRLQYSGLQARGFAPSALTDYTTGDMVDGGYKQRFNYMNLHADAMFNLNALFGGYNPNRVYEIIPYVGFGFTHSYTEAHRQCMSANAGLLNRFRISDAWDINLELSIVGMEDKFDAGLGGKGYDGVVSATVGVTYRFAKRGFDKPKPQLISESELDHMRNKIKEMAAEKQQLTSALDQAKKDAAQKPEPQVIVKQDVTPRTVFFTIGSAKVSKRESMNLSYMAETMKNNPESTYVVNGYADSATGTPEFNQQLAKKRAEAVIKVLVDEYGVDASRLSVGKTEAVDSFGEPILNRVVLVESSK